MTQHGLTHLVISETSTRRPAHKPSYQLHYQPWHLHLRHFGWRGRPLGNHRAKHLRVARHRRYRDARRAQHRLVTYKREHRGLS